MLKVKRNTRFGILGAVLLSVVASGTTARLGAQEGGLFTAAPGADSRQGERRALAEIRSRAVGIDVARLPQSVADDRDDRVVLNLFGDTELVAEIDRIEDRGDGVQVYVGHVEGLADHVEGLDDHSVTLVVSEGVMIGSINTPRAVYQVRFDGETHVVRQVDPDAFPDELDPTPTASLPYTPDDPLLAAGGLDQPVGAPNVGLPPAGDAAVARDAADTGSRVDVMVLYTATARAAAGGTTALRNLITLGITETNQMYANSGIGTRMRLVHMREVVYAESGNAETDRNRLFNGADGHLDAAHGWRNTYGADMVQMLVNNAGSGCGIAYLNGPAGLMAAQSAYAYAVTDWQCVSPNYTFAHEFGHIQGSNHAPGDPTGAGAYAYSFGFKRCPLGSVNFRSVMAYACSSGATGTARSKYFSNPAVLFGGQPTGAASQNNAASMHNTRITVANFRTEQPLVSITSLWPPVNQPFGKTTTLWAYVVNNGPYPLPASARVWFWTDGPGSSTGEGWVGSASLSGLAPSTGAWYSYSFTIPVNANPGAWVYWSRVYDGAAGEYLSNWRGPQAFTVLNLAATVTHVWPVPVTQAGNPATLWARVQNTGTTVFPAGTSVYYWVTGPGSQNGYVGSRSVAGLAPGAADWYSGTWNIPIAQPGGNYTYRAIVWYQAAGGWRALSGWSANQAFTVTAAPAFGAAITSLYTVRTPSGNAPQTGQPARLWALVRNTGTNAHDANTRVYFWVTGPGQNGYVGSQVLTGLASGGSTWKQYDWAIPFSASTGAYSYRAIVWRWTGSAWVALSGWSATQNFNVGGLVIITTDEAPPEPAK